MAYRGQEFIIQLGGSGIVSDLPQDKMPPGSLIRAENVELKDHRLDKAPGSEKYNQTALADKVNAFLSYEGVNAVNKVVALLNDGSVWKLSSPVDSVVVSAAVGSVSTLLMGSETKHIMKAGNEGSGKTKKIFIFSGRSPIQVIDNDGATRADITTPATDWSGSNQPSFGIIHRNRVWAFGNDNFPHVIYTSLPGDHEDFTSSGSLTNFVFPEDGDRLNGAFVFKKKLYLSKYPRGFYALNDTNADDTLWYFEKINSDFAFGSAHSAVTGLDQFFTINSTNTITQVSATQKFGDVISADLLRNMAVEGMIQATMVKDSHKQAWALYHQAEKKFYYTYRTTDSVDNNRILVADHSVANPKVSLLTKDDPICLGLLRNTAGGETPAYGSSDGYVMKLDDPDRRVNKASGVAYEGLFQTPHTDFGINANKNFDALEITFEPTGDWDTLVDVYIDGKLKETITFQLTSGDVLDEFVLDVGTTSSLSPRSITKQLHGHGRTISFVVKNSGLDESFKINKMTVYLRGGGQGQKDGAN